MSLYRGSSACCVYGFFLTQPGQTCAKIAHLYPTICACKKSLATYDMFATMAADLLINSNGVFLIIIFWDGVSVTGGLLTCSFSLPGDAFACCVFMCACVCACVCARVCV